MIIIFNVMYEENMDIFNLPQDIIYNISEYLAPIHVYNFTKTCKYYMTTVEIKLVIIKEINRRLTIIFGDKLAGFKNVMRDTCSMISGSFILQCILGEYWDKSDIDIFVPANGNDITKLESGYLKSDMDDFMFKVML